MPFAPRTLLALLVLALPLAAAPAAGAATFDVNVPGDSPDATVADGICDADTSIDAPGLQCTLRAAIQQANTLTTADRIEFHIVPQDAMISPATTLPTITGEVTIDGTTQPGRISTRPGVRIDGALLTSPNVSATGLILQAKATVRGLAITRFRDLGIVVYGGPVVIQGNHLGTDLFGRAANVGNGTGISVTSTAGHATIGGATDADRNVISGNQVRNIDIRGTSRGILVQGNFVGIDALGGTDITPAGTVGVDVSGASNMSIGGGQGQSNTIAGNSYGIRTHFSSGTVRGNRIGLRADNEPVPNAIAGIGLVEGSSVDVGGSGPGEANIIANTAGPGVEVEDARRATVAHNVVRDNTGDGVEVVAGTGARIGQNELRDNGGLGIDLGPDGVTPNDAAPDADTGGNGLQNHPLVTGVGGQAVQGTLESAPNTEYEVELYRSPACDASGRGEGAKPLGAVTVTTDAAGRARFERTFAPNAITPGSVVTATASGPDGTSELSPCRAVTASTATAADAAGDEGGTAVFRIAIDGGAPAGSRIAYGTADGTARVDSDYAETAGVLQLAEGQTEAVITVPLRDDDADETDESFSLRLDPDGVVLSPSQVTGTIRDTDAPPDTGGQPNGGGTPSGGGTPNGGGQPNGGGTPNGGGGPSGGPPNKDTRRPAIALKGMPKRGRCVSRRTRLRLTVNDASPLRALTVKLGRRMLKVKRSKTQTLRLGRQRSGRHRLTVIATDSAGNRGRRTVRLKVCRAHARKAR